MLPFNNAIAHCVFSLGCGGAERNLVTTVRQLHTLGFRNQHIVVSDFSSQSKLYYEKELFPLATIHYADNHEGEIHGTYPFFLRLLPRNVHNNIVRFQNCLQKIQPDVVHVWSDNAYAAMAASLLPIRRILISWHSMPPVFWHKLGMRSWKQWPKTGLDTLLFHWAIQNHAVRLSCVCQVGSVAYAHWFGIPVCRIHTLYHGLNPLHWERATPEKILEEKKRLGIPSQGKVVLGLMRFDTVKRPELWFDVAERTRQQFGENIYFVCFGDGPLRKKLLQCFRMGGVICPGATRNVSLALSMADIFLHTAYVEGLPTVHLEAQLMGLPIVTTNAGGTKETIIEGVTAQLIPEQPDMVTALSNALLAALQNDDFLSKAAQVGPRFVKEKFSIEKMIQTTLELYS